MDYLISEFRISEFMKFLISERKMSTQWLLDPASWLFQLSGSWSQWVDFLDFGRIRSTQWLLEPVSWYGSPWSQKVDKVGFCAIGSTQWLLEPKCSQCQLSGSCSQQIDFPGFWPCISCCIAIFTPIFMVDGSKQLSCTGLYYANIPSVKHVCL